MAQVIFGKNPVLEAFASGVSIEKVYVLASLRGELEIKIRNLCKDHQIPLAKVPEVKLKDLVHKKNHQGVVAMISPIVYSSFDDLMTEVTASRKFMVILDHVTDIRNIGAIARSAHYFGAAGIVLSGNFSGQINEDAIKTSAGALLKLKVCRINSLLASLGDLQNRGIITLAADMKGKTTLKDLNISGPAAIVMGAEDKGLHYKILENVDEIVRIPGTGEFDSLNVSVAAGIFCYEISAKLQG